MTNHREKKSKRNIIGGNRFTAEIVVRNINLHGGRSFKFFSVGDFEIAVVNVVIGFGEFDMNSFGDGAVAALIFLVGEDETTKKPTQRGGLKIGDIDFVLGIRTLNAGNEPLKERGDASAFIENELTIDT